ncbi:VIT1/CCC1 transporter family protein [Candidatus Altiarchaeota archaeon]
MNLNSQVKSFKKKIEEYAKITGFFEIARRYFVMNSFDGILTILGVIIGAHIGGVTEPHIIISASLAGSVALGISGFSSAYMTEKAERTRKLKGLEKAMLVDLENTIQGEASRFVDFATALINGISPTLASFIILTPFFGAHFRLLSGAQAFWASVSLAFILLFGLGAYLAKISDENILKYGSRMLVVGLVAAFASMILALLLSA